MLNLTATDIVLIREALAIGEDKLRYTGTLHGAEYKRSLAMARLIERMTAALDTLPVPTRIEG